jgi:hypothetical protein
MCIAQRFALLGVKLALAQILKDFHFEATAETKVSQKRIDIELPTTHTCTGFLNDLICIADELPSQRRRHFSSKTHHGQS